MELVKNAINWFEIPVTNFDRAKKFYETIFAYDMPLMVMEGTQMGMLPYDAEGGGVGGCICLSAGYNPSGENGVRVYLNGGDDLSTVLSRVEGAGGTITLPKTQISPEIGFMAFFIDTEGSVVALHSMG